MMKERTENNNLNDFKHYMDKFEIDNQGKGLPTT